MTAQGLFNVFSNLFPNLVDDILIYKKIGPNVLEMQRRHVVRGAYYTFIYKSDVDWQLIYSHVKLKPLKGGAL